MISIYIKCDDCPYIDFFENKKAVNHKNFRKIKRCKKDIRCDNQHYSCIEYYMRINNL